MSFEMRPFNRWHMSGLLLGGLELLFAICIAFLNSTIGQTLDYYGMGGTFFFMMIAVGTLCVYGSIVNCRKARLFGLAMTPFVIFPCAVTMFIDGVFNAASIAMPWLGAMSIAILLRDSSRKIRNEPVAD